MKIQDFKDKKIAILGFWKEWKSTLEFLEKIWVKDITLHDSNTDINIWDKKWIKLVLWKNYLNNLEEYDYIFRSPWISPYKNDLFKYKEKLLTQTKVFYELYKWKIISVTQTKWKSTTASLIYDLLKKAWYKVKLVGNIWNPVFSEIDLFQQNIYDFIIYELSSYMLEDLDNHHSFISIIWNIFEDHLDWHKTFWNYKKAKLNILNNSDHLLIWYQLAKEIIDDLKWRRFKTFWWEKAYYAHIWKHMLVNWVNLNISVKPKIPWKHNLSNICAVLWVSYILNIDYLDFVKTINNFLWLPHRLENIWTYKWIIFIDDAISTTPESTIEALKVFWNKTETLFLWGLDRWYNFKNLVKTIFLYDVKNIVFFPETWEKIFDELKKLQITNYKLEELEDWKLKIKSYNIDEYELSKDWKNYILIDKDERSNRNPNYYTLRIFKTSSMDEAVKFAYEFTSFWKICLLSTASPSYNLWKNFEEKWNEFKKYIQKYK